METSTIEKYDRAARHYDRMEGIVEGLLFRRLRQRALSLVRGPVLEVGVGTGKNLPHYPPGTDVTAVDFSPGMLEKAAEKKERLGLANVKLLEMDVQELAFADDTFATVISTFVFCTVPDPLQGLREVYRVLQPAGRAVFLEHMKSESPLVNLFLRLMDVYSVRALGTSMLRETQSNIAAAGFQIERAEHLFLDVVRLVVARKQGSQPRGAGGR